MESVEFSCGHDGSALEVGVAFVDGGGIFRSTNAVHARTLGLAETAVIGRHMREVLGLELWPLAEPHVRRALGGQPAGFRHDGATSTTQFSYAPRIVEGGRVDGFLVIAQDLSALRQIETDLRESAATLRAIFDAASEGLVVAGEEGLIRLVNRMSERLFGYGPGELKGLPIEALIPHRLGERHLQHRAGFFGAPRARPMGHGLDLQAVRKDGSEFPVEVSLGFVETASGRLAIAFVTDITERKRLE